MAASNEPSRWPLRRLSVQLQAASGCGVEHHRALDGVQLDPVQQPDRAPAASPRRTPGSRRWRGLPVAALPGRDSRRRPSETAVASARRRDAAQTTRRSGRLGERRGGSRSAIESPAVSPCWAESWAGTRHSAGPSLTSSAASSVAPGRPSDLGSAQLAGAHIHAGQPGRAALHNDRGQEVVGPRRQQAVLHQGARRDHADHLTPDQPSAGTSPIWSQIATRWPLLDQFGDVPLGGVVRDAGTSGHARPGRCRAR